VPAGNPSGLRSAARQFRDVGAGLSDSADELQGMPTMLGSWQGPASANYASSCLSVSDAARRAGQGWQARAVAIEAYADELEEARSDAREAIADAREAKRRIDRAKVELADARRRLSEALSQARQASQQIAASAGSGTPDVGAEAALRQAEKAADEAEQDIRHWSSELDDAQEAFERAVRRGNRAERRADLAARKANGALREVDASMPQWVPSPIPALTPSSGDAPDPDEEGFWDKGLPGALKDTGNFAGDVGYGLGQGGEELFNAATHPGQTVEGLAHSVTHPGDTLDALLHSCDGMSAGDCIGYLGSAAVGTKGATKAVSTARKGTPREPGGGKDRDASPADDAARADANAYLAEKLGEGAGMAGLPMGGEIGKIAGLLSRPEQRLAWQVEAMKLEAKTKKGAAILLTAAELSRSRRRGLSEEQIEAILRASGAR
jgi:hypothetical protein